MDDVKLENVEDKFNWKELTWGGFLEIIIGNLIGAILGAIFIYWSIAITIMFAMALDFPSFGEIIFRWVVTSIIELFYSTEGVEFVNNKINMIVQYKEMIWEYISVFIDKYDYYICYVIAFVDGILEDFKLVHIKEKIVNFFHRVLEKIF